jgi:hypothetical protein
MPMPNARNPKSAAYKERISDSAVQASTGKNWKQWFGILNETGAKQMSHAEIVKFLKDEQRVSGWWRQMIAVGYEQAFLGRKVHQSSEGTFSANCSRTLEITIADAYRAFADDKVRASWLAGDRLQISTARPNKSVRGAWFAGSRVAVGLTQKGAAKTQIAIDHTNLADSRDVEKMKAYWAKNLSRLREKFAV